MTKVRVVIEYDLPESGPLTLEERLAIKEAVTLHAPTIFEHTDGAAFWADGFTVEVLE